MNKVNSLVVSVVLALAVSGCAKSDDQKNIPNVKPPNEKSTPVDLSNRSVDDVLKIKYNKAVLKCELWTQQSVQLDTSGKPTDSASWDLKSGTPMPQVLTLKGKIRNHVITVEIKPNSVGLNDNLSIQKPNLTVYTLIHSPYVKVGMTFNAATEFPAGPFYSSGSGTDENINEKLIDDLVNQALKSQPEQSGGVTIDYGSFRDYAHCFIDTDIKPEYQDQFKVEPKKPWVF